MNSEFPSIEKFASVSMLPRQLDLPPEKLAHIELYDLENDKIGVETDIRIDILDYYKQRVEEILETPTYNDLLNDEINVFIKGFDNTLLYFFERKPIEKDFL
jgi:hypothetical protein